MKGQFAWAREAPQVVFCLVNLLGGAVLTGASLIPVAVHPDERGGFLSDMLQVHPLLLLVFWLPYLIVAGFWALTRFLLVAWLFWCWIFGLQVWLLWAISRGTITAEIGVLVAVQIAQVLGIVGILICAWIFFRVFRCTKSS